MDTEHNTSSRQKAADRAKDLSARADMRQHAHKLIRGFEKLDDAAARKAVWDLVQHACDLSSECRVTFDFREGAFAFTHNGEPFNTHTLLSLIKQVSGKGGAEESVGQEQRIQVGQFGTGFITTHSFGRLFKIDSTLNVGLPNDQDVFVSLQNFEINRRAKDIELLVDDLVKQHKQVYELVETGEQLPNPGQSTTFRYLPNSDIERRKIELAYESLHLYMPLVMSLNDTLKAATIIAPDGREEHYEKDGEWLLEDGIWQIAIKHSGGTRVIYSLQSQDGSTRVILPLEAADSAQEPPTRLARLFLYFPLVGTEDWGNNFVVHSKRFAPTEPRDGLHLDLDNDQTKPLSEENRQVLLEAAGIIYDFVGRVAKDIANPLHLAKGHFGSWPHGTEVEKDFRSLLQKHWAEHLSKLPLVETPVGRRSAEQCWFLRPDLLLDESVVPAMHSIAAILWRQDLPSEKLVTSWTQVVGEWQSPATQWITPALLAQKLEEHGELAELDSQALHQVYAYLLAHGEAKLFDDYRLLPAGGGKFAPRSEVKQPVNLVAQHLEVLQCVLPKVVASFVRPAFADLELALDTYGRKQLERDVNEHTRKVLEGSPSDVTDEVRKGLLLLTSIYTAHISPSVTASVRRKVMPFIFRFYNVEYSECIVPTVTDDDLDYDRTPFRTMLKVFLADFERKYRLGGNWALNEALPLLRECLDILTPYEQTREVLSTAPIFPNQNGRLCLPTSLLVERDFAPAGGSAQQLKLWHQQVLGHEIEEKLVDPAFIASLTYYKPEELKGKNLAANLEAALSASMPLEDINKHDKRSIILDIIIQLSANPEWAGYFTRIDALKANIMLAKISDDKVKNDLFGIIKLEPAQISKLGALARDEKFDQIVALGRAALAAELAEAADFEFKKYIGEGIEGLIRERLQTEMAVLPLEVVAQQGGQDIVVILGEEVVYRIEVKSRWRTSYSATLSHLQALTAAAYRTHYALCCVDMTTYWPDGEDQRYEVEDIRKIEHLIRFVPDIGEKVEDLIADVRAAEFSEDVVKLADEFRVAVPQSVVQQGISMEAFINNLKVLLNQVATSGNIAAEAES